MSDRPTLNKRGRGFQVLFPDGKIKKWSDFKQSPGKFAKYLPELSKEVNNWDVEMADVAPLM